MLNERKHMKIVWFEEGIKYVFLSEDYCTKFWNRLSQRNKERARYSTRSVFFSREQKQEVIQ